MSSINEASLPSVRNLGAPLRPRIALPISYKAIPSLVAVFDFVWVLLLGIGVGVAHNAVDHSGHGALRTYIGSAIVVAALFSAFASAAELHRPSNLLQIRRQIGRALLIWVMVFACLAIVAVELQIGPMFSRGAMLAFFAGGIFAIAISRILLARVLAFVVAVGALARRRIALVGAADLLANDDLLPIIERYGCSISRVFALPEGLRTPNTAKHAIAARMSEVVAYARSADVDEILLAMSWSDVDLIEKAAAALKVLPIPVKLVPDLAVGRLLARPLSEFGSAKVVEIQSAPLSAAARGLKQTLDQCLAGAALILLGPLFALTALAIRLESPGPAFFMQVRVGFNGRRFRIYKFRTMSTMDDGPVIRQAGRNDRRVTRLGRLLRKLSIDELPQLLNVLRGEMSLVGPRPHALAHDDEYSRRIASYAMRRKMKPGITGWAQVNGCRGETPDVGAMQRRVDHDLWYIECWSFWLDLRILAMTAIQLLRPRNVY
jgi:Undecaprenyl-phosphate glucose phosphotransferase